MRGVQDQSESKCPLQFFFFLIPPIFLWLTSYDRQKGREGGWHMACLALSHTLAVRPAPPGTTNTLTHTFAQAEASYLVFLKCLSIYLFFNYIFFQS